MKKTFLFFLFSIAFTFASCNLNNKNAGENGTVNINISSTASRTVSPVDSSNFDFSECAWNVVFASTDSAVKYEKTFEAGSNISMVVPVGSYNITATTTVVYDSTNYVYSAVKEKYKVENNTQNLSLYYELNKTTNGKGYLFYSIPFSEDELPNYADYTFYAELIPVDSEKDSTTVGSIQDEEDENRLIFESAEDSIPSGWYEIKVFYKNEEHEIFAVNLMGVDTLIEIADGLETVYEGAVQQQIVSSRIYYVTNGVSVGKGSFKQYPININEALECVSANQSITRADFYMVEDMMESPSFKLDASKLKTGKSVQVGSFRYGWFADIFSISSSGQISSSYSCRYNLFDSEYNEENPKTVNFSSVRNLSNYKIELENKINVYMESDSDVCYNCDFTLKNSDYYTENPFAVIYSSESDSVFSENTHSIKNESEEETNIYYEKNAAAEEGKFIYKLYSIPKADEDSKLKYVYGGNEVTDETVEFELSEDKNEDVVVKVNETEIPSKFIWISESRNLISRDNSFTINPYTAASEYPSGIISLYCVYLLNNQWKAQSFNLKIFEKLDGLYLDLDNDFFLYFNNEYRASERLIKGRGLWYKEFSVGEVGLSNDERNTVFASDYKGDFNYVPKTSLTFTDMFGDEELLYVEDDGEVKFTGTINGKSLTFVKYAGGENVDSDDMNACYYIANADADTNFSLVNPEDSLKTEYTPYYTYKYFNSGYTFTDIQTAVTAANEYNSAFNGRPSLIFVESDFAATTSTTKMNQENPAYLKFNSNNVYLVGKKAGAEPATIDSSSLAVRTVFWEIYSTIGGTFNTKNIHFIGADIYANGSNDLQKSGGVLYLEPNNQTTYINICDGTTISGGTALNGGGIYCDAYTPSSTTLNIYSGANISGNTASDSAGNGGGIYANCNFNMYGGEITNNYAGYQGGGIYCTKAVHIYGGTIGSADQENSNKLAESATGADIYAITNNNASITGMFETDANITDFVPAYTGDEDDNSIVIGS